MKAVLSLLAVAASALAVQAPAPGANVAARGDWGDDESTKIVWTTTQVWTTYTTVCPVTETKTAPGTTYTSVYTTTSTCTEKYDTTIYETITKPPVTVTDVDTVWTTSTSLCPVTETTVVEGSTVYLTWTSTETWVKNGKTTIEVTETLPPVTVESEAVVTVYSTELCPVTETYTVGGETYVSVWTSTSTIEEIVPTTYSVYVTTCTTEYETTDVYTTEYCPETAYTTVVEGSTSVVEITDTITEYYTSSYICTETYLETLTSTNEVVIGITTGVAETVTAPVTEYTIVNGTSTYYTQPPPTTIYPTTVITSTSSVGTTSTAAVVSTAGANSDIKAPAVAMLAGIFGAIALI